MTEINWEERGKAAERLLRDIKKTGRFNSFSLKLSTGLDNHFAEHEPVDPLWVKWEKLFSDQFDNEGEIAGLIFEEAKSIGMFTMALDEYTETAYKYLNKRYGLNNQTEPQVTGVILDFANNIRAKYSSPHMQIGGQDT